MIVISDRGPLGSEALELELNPRISPFNLDYTLDCGQAFRWKKIGNNWSGVVNENLVRISQRGNRLHYETFPEEREDEDFVKEYFRLDDDLPYIASLINRDKTIGDALNRLCGLRIIRQDPWECLISFILATFANMPRIKGMIHNVCQHFGRKINYKELAFYDFPRKEALAAASINELLECNLGYRARYVKDASQSLLEGGLSLDELRGASYEEARKSLHSLKGVGYKVADCVLLFSLEKLEAFPVDVWVRRILQNHYTHHFNAASFEKSYLTPRVYKEFNDFGRKYFGGYAGYAQEYLYAEYSPVMTRCKNNKDRMSLYTCLDDFP